MAANEVLARVADVASCELLDFIEATGRGCSLSITSVYRRGSAVTAARRAEYQWPEKLGPRLVEKSREKEEACTRRACAAGGFTASGSGLSGTGS